MGVLTLTRSDFSRRGATFRTQTRFYFGHSLGVLSFVTQIRYVDKKNTYLAQYHGSVYLKEQLATRINMIK